MFYSHLLLSKTGALGIVWMAAHCHKKLGKVQIQQTDISSSVDKILDDEVQVVTHRILAFLLLGIVKIYSRKVEYLFNDCHKILDRLCSVKTWKRKQAGIGVYSISFPKRFELDRFDLDLLENQDAAVGNVTSLEKDKLADCHRKEAGTFGLKENIRICGTYPTTFTPPRDVFGHLCVGQNLSMAPSSSDRIISLPGIEILRGTCFSLEDHIDQNQFDKAEKERMHYKQSDEDSKMNFQEPSNDKESDFDVGICDDGSRFLPSLEMHCGTGFSLEDRLEPMVLDEAEMELLDGRPSHHNIISNLHEPIQGMGLDFINHQSSNGSDSVASLGLLHGSDFFVEPYQNFKLNETEKGQGHDKQPDKECRVEEEHLEHLSTCFNFQGGEHHDISASVDNAVDSRAQEVINPESMKCQRPKGFHVFDLTPDSKIPAADAGSSEVATVQTPGRKERAKILKKRKTLLDWTTMVVPNKVFKTWINDPTDLKRKRREITHTALGVWKVTKHAHVPQSFIEPSIPCISVDFEFKRSYGPAFKTVALSSEEDGVNSPVRYGVEEGIPAVRSLVRGKLPRQRVEVRGVVIEESSSQTPIAPGTPSVVHFEKSRSHEAEAVGDSEPASSYESVGKGPSWCEALGFDILFEETSSSEGGKLENEMYSGRTRMTGSYLISMFVEKRRRGEEEVVKLSHLLAGKRKEESARLFYETLVLKTRDCIDVQQDAAYLDILLRHTPKLWQMPHHK